jgi:hypothetical protein
MGWLSPALAQAVRPGSDQIQVGIASRPVLCAFGAEAVLSIACTAGLCDF